MGVREIFDGERFPAYIRLAWAEDDSWMQHGNCRKPSRTVGMERAWTDTRHVDPGYSLTKEKLALGLCHICPVQWQCVKFAIRAQQKHCIWAVRPADRDRLEDTPDWELIIDEAHARAMPVAMVVKKIALLLKQTPEPEEIQCSPLEV